MGNAYAGIGSRETPPHVLSVMEEIATKLCGEGWVLRSGHAPGADQAFERGADGRAEIYLPWHAFEIEVPVMAEFVKAEASIEAFGIASKVHAYWPRMRYGAKSLHARNAHQVLGRDLDDPVEFVLCWTPGARVTGGTATAIKIAQSKGIPVHNLCHPSAYSMAQDWLAGADVTW